MMQAYPVPDMHARGGLAVERVTGCSGALVGAGERANQIELRTRIDYPADAAQNAIHFAKSTEAIDVNWNEVCGLQQKLFVAHEDPPPWAKGNHDTLVAIARQKTEIQLEEFFAHKSVPAGINASGIFDAGQTAAVLS